MPVWPGVLRKKSSDLEIKLPYLSPLKNWSKLIQTLIIKNTNIGKYLHQRWCTNLKGLYQSHLRSQNIYYIKAKKQSIYMVNKKLLGKRKIAKKVYRQSSVKNQLAKILQGIIPSIFSPFLLTLLTSTLANFK